MTDDELKAIEAQYPHPPDAAVMVGHHIASLVAEVRQLTAERDAAVRGDATYAAAVSVDTRLAELERERDELKARLNAYVTERERAVIARDPAGLLLDAQATSATCGAIVLPQFADGKARPCGQPAAGLKRGEPRCKRHLSRGS